MWLSFRGKAYEPLLPWTGVVSSVIIGLCAVFVRKRTDKGVEWLGKILGLKNFINLAERDRIQTLVQENPHYFYNVLPYAYVLGVTDKWVKDFEQITIEPPNWYYGHGSFTPLLFMVGMNSAMNSFRTNMVSTPPKDQRRRRKLRRRRRVLGRRICRRRRRRRRRRLLVSSVHCRGRPLIARITSACIVGATFGRQNYGNTCCMGDHLSPELQRHAL